MRPHLVGLALVCPLAVVIGGGIAWPWAVGRAEEPPSSVKAADAAPGTGASHWTSAVAPKPLSDHVKKGLAWLAEHQGPSGGWGQGEESAQMRQGGNGDLRDKPNVADTCIAALALIRSGSTPTAGPYKDAVARAVRFVEESVEASDSTSITVTTVQGTRVQQKLGPNIDTFLASLLLAEVKGRMGGDSGNGRALAALDKVLDKIKRHQKADGSFDGQGWAPILAQALCGKGINRARQAGARVDGTLLARAEFGAKFASTGGAATAMPAAPAEVVVTDGTVKTSLSGPVVASSSISRPVGASGLGGYARGDAGVELYSKAAEIGVLQDSVNTSKGEVQQLREVANKPESQPEQRAQAMNRLDEIAETEKAHKKAQSDIVDRLGDKGFLAGFGSNGGEEFLSYMNIAESLVVKGGDAWKAWDEPMTRNLNRIQNDDGSWTGHHCITGRTFCTSSALLVLLADRTPVPVDPKPETK